MAITIENGKVRYMGTGVERNPLTGDLELFIQGQFVCGWGKFIGATSEQLINEALNQAYKFGKQSTPFFKVCEGMIAALERAQQAHADTLEEAQLLTLNVHNLTNKVAALLQLAVTPKGNG